MKVNLKDVNGVALDWLVGVTQVVTVDEETLDPITWVETAYPSGAYSFSTNPSLGALLIDRAVSRIEDMGDCWEAESEGKTQTGATVFEAVSRAIVSARLGDEVEVPDIIWDASQAIKDSMPRPRAV